MTYLFTPSEIVAGKAPADARFRIGGMVKEHSIERGQSLTVAFVVTDGDDDMRVEYEGILPDLFREKQCVMSPKPWKTPIASMMFPFPPISRPRDRQIFLQRMCDRSSLLLTRRPHHAS